MLKILRDTNPGLSGGRGVFLMTIVLMRARQRQKRRRQCGHRGRDWSDEATNQGMPTATERWTCRTGSLLEPLEKVQSNWHLDFRVLASRTMRE